MVTGGMHTGGKHTGKSTRKKAHSATCPPAYMHIGILAHQGVCTFGYLHTRSFAHYYLGRKKIGLKKLRGVKASNLHPSSLSDSLIPFC